MQRAIASAAIATEVLGLDPRAVDGLEELSVGALAGRQHDDPELASVFRAWEHGDLARRVPGGETGQQLLDRFREGLQSIADLHRGETVLAFSHGGVMSFAVPRLAGAARQDLVKARFLPNCAIAQVEVDGDGFRVTSWPGTQDRAVV
jgi:broad specificity phosphatase PhoE